MKSIVTLCFIVAFNLTFSQETKALEDFNFVEVYDKIPVKLVKSERNEISISGSKSNEVEAFVTKGKLKIRMTTDNFLEGNDTHVTLYFTHLDEIHANEGSLISSEDSLNGEHLIVNAKEGAQIDLDIDATSVEIKTNSGGKIQLKGNADSQIVVSNSGGNYDGENLKTERTEVTVNAGGEAKVYATQTVDAKTRAGGNIHIYGGAEVSQQTLAGGKIHIH